VRARRFDRQKPAYYAAAEARIACECPRCDCPARGTRLYSFVYLSEAHDTMYWGLPKCGSSTIRSAVFRGDRGPSLRDPRRPLDSYFKFTFVRNPWDRMVSNWKMFTRVPRRVAQIESMTDQDVTAFADFVDFARRQTNHHWVPQTAFIEDDLDFIGRLESFDRDIEEVRRRAGFGGLEFPTVNANPGEPYVEYYTPDLVDTVGEMFRSDVEAFGYEFGTP
jgi:hypothetical protein